MKRGTKRRLAWSVALVFGLSLGLAAMALAAGEKIVVEAEAANKVVKKMEVLADPACSGGKCVWAPVNRPHGVGAEYKVEGYCEYKIKVSTAGAYKFWGYVAALDACGNSFGVQVDDNDPVKFEWAVGQQKYQWGWRDIKQLFQLSAGVHTVKILMSEDGPKMDQWMLWNDTRRVPVKLMPATLEFLVK